MQSYSYTPVDSRASWSVPQVLTLSVVATASALVAGSSVAAYTSLQTTSTQSAVSTRVAVPNHMAASVSPSTAQVPSFVEAPAVPEAVEIYNVKETVVNRLMAPVAAVLTGLAVYLVKSSRPSNAAWNMASTDEEANKDSALVGKPYKSSSRADSYYGKPEGETVEQVNPMQNTYKPPVGAYDAPSDKKYTPTTSVTSSYYGPASSSKVPLVTYSPPKGGYDATNGKTYVPTTTKEASYYGKDQGAVDPVKGAMWYGADRPKWLGPATPASAVPDYLKGELPGDYGFDTASLGSDPARLAKYREAELMNARWAMLGALGCVWPEFCAKFFGYGIGEPVWFKAGAAIFNNAQTDVGNKAGYVQSIFSNGNSGNGIPLSPVGILIVQLLLMGLVEGWRASRVTGRDALYPGLYFDPLGLAKDPDTFAELKVKEIKNGRLAMIAMLGFFVQSAVTGQGPVQNLLDHLANPLAVNGLSQTYATVFTPGA